MLRSVVNGDPEKTILQVKTYIIMHAITFVMPRFRPLIVCNYIYLKYRYEIFSLYFSFAVTRTLSSHECVLYSASRNSQNIYRHIPIRIFSICFELFNVMKRNSSYEYSGVIDYTWHNHNWHLQNQIIAKKCVFKTIIQYNFA